MAFISTGGAGKARAVDHDLPLVPFIDFLLCLIAFLLVTAVWTQMARVSANASVPGEPGPNPPEPPKELHVRTLEREFELTWRRGGVVLESKRVPRTPLVLADGTQRFPALADAVRAEWTAQGTHRAASDRAQDRAVLHTSNATEFGDIVAVIDAMSMPRPSAGAPSASAHSPELPAFSMSFAVD